MISDAIMLLDDRSQGMHTIDLLNYEYKGNNNLLFY